MDMIVIRRIKVQTRGNISSWTRQRVIFGNMKNQMDHRTSIRSIVDQYLRSRTCALPVRQCEYDVDYLRCNEEQMDWLHPDMSHRVRGLDFCRVPSNLWQSSSRNRSSLNVKPHDSFRSIGFRILRFE